MKLLEVLKLNVLQKFMVVKRQSDPNGAPCHISTNQITVLCILSALTG